jgi:hypothetical protein
MREEIVDILIRLRTLRVIDDSDEEFDRLMLVADVARLIGATPEDLGEALMRYNRATQEPARER